MSPAARDAYRDLLVKLMADDDRLYCLDSDTGLFTKSDFGLAADRYVNLGIAEHNLMGVAAGLAASGKMPFVNTMATFATTRASAPTSPTRSTVTVSPSRATPTRRTPTATPAASAVWISRCSAA